VKELTIHRQPTYQAARSVAGMVEAHFERHLAEARQHGERKLAHAPDSEAIETIVDATFWASFRPEEGRFPKISLAYLSPEQAGQPLMLEQRLALTTANLIKLAPAVERPGIHLGVWREDEELYIWGATRVIPSLGFVVEDVEPGLLVIKHRRIDGFGKFANVAVLKGEQVKLVDERGASLPDCPDLIRALKCFTAPATWDESVNVPIQLAASMRAHGHGGILLMVPRDREAWRDSIVHPIEYAVGPAYAKLGRLIKEGPQAGGEDQWQASVRSGVELIAGLTAVDGATLITEDFEVLAFGVKIKRAAGRNTVEQMVVTEAIVGNRAEVVSPVQQGGMRHLSAAQFIDDQKNSLALVASQDGRFTVFGWSPCEQMVHAHRVDVLLL
jgi:hypothetical protein